MHRGMRIAATILVVGMAGVIQSWSIAPPAEAQDCVGSNCPEIDPRGDGWAGNIPAQVNEANRGRGGAPPTPCDPELRDLHRFPETDGYDPELVEDPSDSEVLQGYVRWVFNTELNDWNQERGENAREGTYFTRVCHIDGEDVPYHFHRSACRYEHASGLCNAECVGGEIQDWCQNGQVNHFFDAVDPVQLTEYAVMESFEELLDDPQPNFSPDGTTIVNFETYLWVSGTDTREEFDTSISVADVTLAIHAERGDFIWDMGEGEPPRVCPDPGNDGVGQVPTCVYRYERSSGRERDGRFHGTVSIEWVGTYTGIIPGVGLIQADHPVLLEEEFDLAVAEGQSIVVG